MNVVYAVPAHAYVVVLPIAAVPLLELALLLARVPQTEPETAQAPA